MGTRTETNVTYYNDGRPPETETVTVETTTIVLSKTSFNKFVANVLGAGDFMAGADAFQGILAACKAKDDRVGFCFTQYEAADTFEKSEVDLFTTAMVAATPQIMTEQQRTAILAAWPEK